MNSNTWLKLIAEGESRGTPMAKGCISAAECRLLLSEGVAELRPDGTGKSRPRERWYLTAKGREVLVGSKASTC